MTASLSIRVLGLADARAACRAAAELGVPLLLVSVPGASASAGALWFREVTAKARADFPDLAISALLDCADRAGDVLGALEAGVDRLCFTGRQELAERLAAVASAQGAVLLTALPPALDLRGARDPAAACRDWLEQRRDGYEQGVGIPLYRSTRLPEGGVG